jgi:hypothetical protein
MRQVLNHAMLALAISLGRRTGLLETMARLPPSTSAGIAGAAGLDERYVREWLGAMVTGRIVDYDGSRGTYWLPPEHAAVLTDAAGADDMALAMQSVPALGRVEAQVAGCFRSGAGLPAAELEEWTGLRREELSRRHRASLIGEVLGLVPGLVEGLRGGIDVLELGAGCDQEGLLQRAFPASRFRIGEPEAAGTDPCFDLVIAFDYLHEHPRPHEVLATVHALLRPGGTLLCMEMAGSSELADNVEHPLGPAVYTVSTLHCLPRSRAAGGVGLGAMWGEAQARRMIAAAGLRDVAARRIDSDVTHVYYVATKPV